MARAIDKQVGGDHYKGLAIQPIEYILKNRLGFVEGNVVKYITRWQQKGGRSDLEKVKHYVELLLESLPAEPPVLTKTVDDKPKQIWVGNGPPPRSGALDLLDVPEFLKRQPQ